MTKTTEEKYMLILKIHSRNGNMGRVLPIHYNARNDGRSRRDVEGTPRSVTGGRQQGEE